MFTPHRQKRSVPPQILFLSLRVPKPLSSVVLFHYSRSLCRRQYSSPSLLYISIHRGAANNYSAKFNHSATLKIILSYGSLAVVFKCKKKNLKDTEAVESSRRRYVPSKRRESITLLLSITTRKNRILKAG